MCTAGSQFDKDLRASETSRRLRKRRKSVKDMRAERQGTGASQRALLQLQQRIQRTAESTGIAPRRARAGRRGSCSERRLSRAADAQARLAAEEDERERRHGPTAYRPRGGKGSFTHAGARELLMHVALTCSFSAVMLGSRDYVFAHPHGELLRRALLEREMASAVSKPFDDVSSLDDVWLFLRTALVPALLDDGAAPRAFAGWTLHQNRMLGALRLRQVRVATSSCAPAPLLARLSNGSARPACYAAISAASQRTAPIYGAPLRYVNGTHATRRVYRHSSPSPFTRNTRYGFALLRDYPTAGYLADLPATRADAEEVLRQLEADGWLNQQTRAVSVQFTVANANINMLCAVRLVFERLETGGVFPFAALHPIRPSRYEGAGAQGRRWADACSILFVAYFMLQELWEMRYAIATDKEGLWAYFRRPANALDWANIAVFWAVLGCRRTIAAELARAEAQAPYDPRRYYDLDVVVDFSAAEANLMAVNALLVYLKVLRFLAGFARVEALLATLRNAAHALALFLLVFVGIMTAYAAAFFFAFGHEVAEYRSVGDALVSLFRLLLGDLDADALARANPWLFALLAVPFVLSVCLILLSMFLAILSEHHLRSRVSRDGADEALEAAVALLLRAAAAAQRKARAARRAAGKAATFVAKYGSKEPARARARQGARAAPSGACEGASDAADAVRRMARFVPEEPEDAEHEMAPELWQGQVREMLEPREAAGQRTARATEDLKALYLRVADGQRETMDLIEHVALAVRAQQHENALLLNGLRARGVELSDDAIFQRTPLTAERSPAWSGARHRRKRTPFLRAQGQGDEGQQARGESPAVTDGDETSYCHGTEDGNSKQ